MEGQAGGLDRGHNELRRRAKKLLGEGLPIDLTRPDATKYLERAESVHHELSAYVTGPATDPAAQLMLVQVLASMTASR